MNFIENVHEPHRLLLIWQGPEGSGRTRRAVAELVKIAADRVRFQYLKDTADFAAAQAEGFITFPAFRKLDVSYDLGVVETFMRRLPPRSRGDYAQYLEQFRLRPDTSISDFALLGYTGAKLPSDGFSILNPLEEIGDACDVLLEVAGFRHVSRLSSQDICADEPVTLVAQQDNPHDPLAVAMELRGERIGYVPRQQAPALRGLLNEGVIEAWVERINGKPERPLIHVLARIRRQAILPGPSPRVVGR